MPVRRASLLMVIARPDDEIFHGGALAHLSKRGVRVTLACATDGEAGKPHPSIDWPQTADFYSRAGASA